MMQIEETEETTVQDIITDGEIYFTISFWNNLSNENGEHIKKME